MTLDLPDIIGLFTLVQLVFLATAAFNFRRGRRLSNKLLAGFMASNALLIANFLLVRFRWMSPDVNAIPSAVGSASYFLLMPFLYLYVRSLCYNDFRLKPKHLLHLIPFVLASALTTTVRVAGRGIQGLAQTEHLVHQILLHLQISSYLIASGWTLMLYRRRLKQIYSSIERIDLSWCNLLLAGFTCMWLCDLSGWALDSIHAIPGSARFALLVASLVVNLTFTLAVAYKGLVRAESFSGILTPPKYATSALTHADSAAIMDRLTLCMESSKPFLEASLSVEDLAKRLNVSSRHLSQVIHSRLNQNFYDLVNRYRIEAAKERLKDASSRSQTLLAVAYDVGFNSKSVFNAAFKRHAGMTPKEFRQKFAP